jgi:hypothetical protein
VLDENWHSQFEAQHRTGCSLLGIVAMMNKASGGWESGRREGEVGDLL